MKKRNFETYHKRFRDFEILTKFSETHVFRGTIAAPSLCGIMSTLILKWTSKEARVLLDIAWY